jgi:hypothetical protein
MTDTSISTVSPIVDAYLAAWNEGDAERRRALVADAFADDATYLDPLMSSDGHDGIDAMIARAQEQYPGTRFVLAEGPDAHHDRVRFTWQLEPAGGGAAIAVGIDFATLADDGRLRDVTGFLAAP